MTHSHCQFMHFSLSLVNVPLLMLFFSCYYGSVVLFFTFAFILLQFKKVNNLPYIALHYTFITFCLLFMLFKVSTRKRVCGLLTTRHEKSKFTLHNVAITCVHFSYERKLFYRIRADIAQFFHFIFSI